MSEAAERLRGSFDGISQTTADGVTWFDPEQELDAALAAERKATVERIRVALGVPFWSVGVSGAYFDMAKVLAILDEVAK